MRGSAEPRQPGVTIVTSDREFQLRGSAPNRGVSVNHGTVDHVSLAIRPETRHRRAGSRPPSDDIMRATL